MFCIAILIKKCVLSIFQGGKKVAKKGKVVKKGKK